MPAERYHQVLLPVLRVAAAVAQSLDSETAKVSAATFIARHSLTLASGLCGFPYRPGGCFLAYPAERHWCHLFGSDPGNSNVGYYSISDPENSEFDRTCLVSLWASAHLCSNRL